jgi:hypothetical protein
VDQKTIYMKALLADIKGFKDPIPIIPFADWDYYYIVKPLTWTPSETELEKYNAITAPTGFVTDLASIPSIFWSVLPPAGRYSYAAIIHDYLYWFQPPSKTGGDPRAYADEVLRIAMGELGVPTAKLASIYKAVRLFGSSAWVANGQARANGEKRVLRVFPLNTTTSWQTWKSTPGVFS